ncbi:6-phospho-3-hexuloisomerase [Salicibibacter halophilus]|uniref:6-phospho-3-hexuloisomerase n=1 Tax=Salicibibacter halophilus TaxID=2502791 RepID=A0A514LL74_9BACI|nr:6-phospho-3-hexuloisomerase [Salicibibacter halophilus]QDI92566.1 6-phospho-3-hexuloisomerase [Salicibibacter halophilus]
MDFYKETALSCIKEVHAVVEKVSEDQLHYLANMLTTAKRIFISGEGRSGLMGKAFAMRLMHAGYHVYVVGETVTPSIERGDLLVLISGSGSSVAAYDFAKKTREKDASIALVTTNRDAEIGKISDKLLVLPAATKYRKTNEPDTIQPLGNQFDQSVHILLDALIVYLNQESNEKMRKRHTNME